MSKARVVIKYQNFVQLRNSPQVVADLAARAAMVAAAAGDGFEARPVERNMSGAKGRARVAVVTASFPAMYHEAKDRTLTRALDAGR